MSDTKVISRTVNISLSHNFSKFDFSAVLASENGVEANQIEQEGKVCQAMAEAAVKAYMEFLKPHKNIKEDIKQIESKIEKLKAVISEKIEPEVTDPKEIAEIESLPMYGEIKSDKVKKSTKKA